MRVRLVLRGKYPRKKKKEIKKMLINNTVSMHAKYGVKMLFIGGVKRISYR